MEANKMNPPKFFKSDISDFDAIRLSIASPADIMDWSYGEVTKPETINYRTQKPERDGLFCERIFGPVKDINPHDNKYKGVRSREAAVDKKGELVTKSIVRRERMGHISLAVPVVHIWFLKGSPSAIGQILGITVKNLEKVSYFASYIIKSVDLELKAQIIADQEALLTEQKEEIVKKYEAEAAKKDANIKSLAEMQSKEIGELEKEFGTFSNQASRLEKYELISEADFRDLNENLKKTITIGIGAKAIQELLAEIDLSKLINELDEEVKLAKGQKQKKLMKRLKLIESIYKAGIEPNSMCLSVLPVIPPDLRPMVQLTGGRFATSDMNDLYRRVINRNNRLKKLIDLNAPEVIQRNEQRMLQEAVDALIDNNSTRSGRAVSSTGQKRKLKSLSDLLKGKQGRFRQNLLGKRVDYSGRSVIVSGPELKMNQCGLPKMMALELFKPFVIGELITNEKAHNIRGATRLIESGESTVWDALDKVIRDKYVLLNRAPSLHRLSVQAFQPVLIEGRAIQLHPLVCKGFNADFDGDQMAVHLPLSKSAQKEAKEIMAATRNLLKPADGSPVLHIEQDIVLGAYYLTFTRNQFKQEDSIKFSDLNEALMAFDENKIALQSYISIKFRGQEIQSTLGRFIFNEILPEDFPFQDRTMSKKELQKVMGEIYPKYGQERTAIIGDLLKDLGFDYSTISGLSMGLSDFINVHQMDQSISEADIQTNKILNQYEEGFINQEERHRLIVENWIKVDSKIQDLISEQMKDSESSMAISFNSGARGNVTQMKRSVGILGVMSDAAGNAIELPIKSGYVKGLNPLEYFNATRGTRKSLIDIALKTADAGYLTRRLVDVSQDLFTVDVDNIESVDPGFNMLRSDADEIGINFGERLIGRYLAENIPKIASAGELITKEIAEKIDQNENINQLKIYSVLSSSKSFGIPQLSYGIDPATGQLVSSHHPIGVIAAQSIGEPGTQLSLDSKHRGGAVLADNTAQGLTRVEELFEARSPKGQAYLAEFDGIVNVWEEGDRYILQLRPSGEQNLRFKLGSRKIFVKSESDVFSGDIIAANEDGSDPIVAPISGKLMLNKDVATLSPTKQASIKYEVAGFKQVYVKDGDKVIAGQKLTSGSVNLNDLLRLQGVESTQRYIMNEILKIFVGQGQIISDKHLEVIIRQMFSKVLIDDSGDSDFITADIVNKNDLIEINSELLKKGKKPAKYTQLLLGITKASLSTTSFLSAASFQDTNRVLINAAISGKIDHLVGLKENVILGRKIPVGTGWSESQFMEEDELGTSEIKL